MMLDLLPLTVTMRHLERLIVGDEAEVPVGGPSSGNGEPADRVIERWVRSKTLIEGAARASGVSTTFVWQPIPTYGGLRAGPGSGAPVSNRSGFAYPRMAAYAAAHPLGASFVWCAEPGEGRLEQLYVDAVHYGPVMADRVAGCASEAMRSRGLVP